MRIGIIGAASEEAVRYVRALEGLRREGLELVCIADLGRDTSYIRNSIGAADPNRTGNREDTLFPADAHVPVVESADTLIEEYAVDAVCITTEDYLHQRYALNAIEKGIHVLVANPFLKSRAESAIVFETAKERGVAAMPSLPARYSIGAKRAGYEIEAGTIGRPISGHFVSKKHIPLGSWKSDPSMASGPEYELGFYMFDLMRMLIASRPVRVRGLGVNLDHRGIPYIDNGKCIIECSNGAIVSVDFVLSMHQDLPELPEAYIIGDEGALILGSRTIQVRTLQDVRTEQLEPDFSYVSSYREELLLWRSVCEGKETIDCCQEQAVAVLDIINAYISSYTNDVPIHIEE